jgi:hypothetical protein
VALLWADGMESNAFLYGRAGCGSYTQQTGGPRGLAYHHAIYASYSTWIPGITANPLYIGYDVKIDAATSGYDGGALPGNLGSRCVVDLSNYAMSLQAMSDGSIKVYRGAVNGTLLNQTSTGVFTFGRWVRVEVYLDATDSGRVVVKLDGTQVIDFSGDLYTGVAPTSWRWMGSNTQDTRLANVSVNDTTGSTFNAWPGFLSIPELLPNANGNTNQGAGSDGNSTDNYLLVDEHPTMDTGDYIDVGYANSDWYGFTNPVLSGSILGVQTHMTGASNASNSMSFYTRVGGSNYKIGANQELAGTATGYVRLSETNPNTSAAWTSADIDAAEFGYVGE